MKKVLTKLASELCSHIDLEKEARAVLDEKHTPEQYIQALMADKQYYSAVVLMAHALPRRESVWWACVCSKATITATTSKDNLEALKAAEQWVYTPTEDVRRLAEKLAEVTEFVTPYSWAAMAAFWSGGSITGINEPAVPPAQYLYANAVAGSINLAATFSKHNLPETLYLKFIKQGFDIANGGSGEIAAA